MDLASYPVGFCRSNFYIRNNNKVVKMKPPDRIILMNMHGISGPNERDCFSHYLQGRISKFVKELSKQGRICTELTESKKMKFN